MPTASFVSFWLNGWGPQGTLVPSSITMSALKDFQYASSALKDPQLVGAGVAGAQYAQNALKDFQVARDALKDPGVNVG